MFKSFFIFLTVINSPKITPENKIYSLVHSNYSEAVMGNEILRSKAASNCALTDIYKNIYVFKKKMYRTVNERKSDAKTKTKQNSVTAKRNQQILT